MAAEMRIVNLQATYDELPFRTPLVFATGEVRTHTLATVTAQVEGEGRMAVGRGAILLGTTWAWPGGLSHDSRDRAMRLVTERLCRQLEGATGHPLDLWWGWKGELPALGRAAGQQAGTADVPTLATLVAASPVDAALHDAFGRLHGVDSYTACGPALAPRDLSAYLGAHFRGRYVTDYLRSGYAAAIPAVHLVGGADKLRTTELTDADPQDGLPVSLEQWIARDGVWALKVKLKGTDLDWDLARLLSVVEVVEGSGLPDYALTIDTNEMCSSPGVMVELLERFRAASPRGFELLRYLEQPTERDLSAHRHDMRQLAAMRPVLADEGVVSLETWGLAQELGWSGLALKTCKGHSAALLYLALLEQAGRPYSVQDLTNPGLALLHSAGLAARSRPLLGVEYNARQYLPTACRDVQVRWPGVFGVGGGQVTTGQLGTVGLGY